MPARIEHVAVMMAGALAAPLRFVVVGGIAAVTNFCARILLSSVLSYTRAIVIAYLIGMIVAFVLNRSFVFPDAGRRLDAQIFWFCAINALAVLQTLLISLWLARVLLPAMGIAWHAEEIAHAVGIAVPVLSSYLGHRYLTFRP